MINNNHESETAGSYGTQGRRVNYPLSTSTVESANRDVRNKTPQPSTPPRQVFRKTELFGATPGNSPDDRKKTRLKTYHELKNPGGVVSYQQFENVFRDFVCSLMERQDMFREEFFCNIADLRQQIEALEEKLEQYQNTTHTEPDPQGRSS